MRHERKKHRQRSVVEKLENRWLLNGDMKGTVLDQTNGNAGMSGVTVYIDANDNRILDSGEISVVTDSSAVFQFTNLPASYSYLVRQVVPADYEETSTPWSGTVIDNYVNDIGSFVNVHYWMVKGTSGDDIVTAQADSGGAKVTVNGVSEIRSLNNIRAISLWGRDGNDRITIDGQLQFPTRIFGDAGNDTIIGGPKEDTIFAGGGDDSIQGGAGNDSIRGGGGNDRISAGDGNDRVKGDGGNNFIHGGAGNDSIEGSSGVSAGRATVFGDDGNDSIFGGRKNDSLLGGAGNDSIWGMNGGDRILGGAGDDVLVASDFQFEDFIWGGSGNDRLSRDHKDHWQGVEKESVPAHPSSEPFIGGCFLTTAVVHWAGKADDCYELTVLRRFRDGYMRGLPDGQEMIRDYYQHAPRVVEVIGQQNLGDEEWPKVYAMVQEAVRLIEAGRNEEALALYSAEYLRLKAEYVELAVV